MTRSPVPAQPPKWPFRLWLTAASLSTLLVLLIGVAWLVRHAVLGGTLLSPGQARAVIAVAEFPPLVVQTLRQVRAGLRADPEALLMPRQLVEKPSWQRRFPAPEDEGYLLWSGVDSSAHQSVVKLLRISDGAELARWVPDWPAIYRGITPKPHRELGDPASARAIHPLLLDDGDIVFNIEIALLRLGPCSTQPVWVLDEHIHHSVEPALDAAVWVASTSNEGLADSPWLQKRVRDEAIAKVSLDGQVLERVSVIRILRDNGFHTMLFGNSGSRLIEDPIHLNEIRVASQSGRHWQRGDLLFSARNLSTVFLYRPSTGKVVWHQTGPWLNQHSVDFVDDHRISVFDNNVVLPAPPAETAFLLPTDNNRFFVYDFETQTLSQPFAGLMDQTRPQTVSQGRGRLLPDGGLFIEETDVGRLLRFSSSQLIWSLVNDYDAQRVGVLSWSRYLTADEARAPLNALDARKCSARGS
jgi:hypothetical protein